MKISFTIEIDDLNNSKVNVVPQVVESPTNISVPQEPVKEEPVKGRYISRKVSPTTSIKREPKNVTREWIGEGLPRETGKRIVLKGLKEYPYNAAMVKDYIDKSGVRVSAVAKVIGMDDIRLRNILRWDNRGFSEEDYNVIVEAVESIKQRKVDESKNKKYTRDWIGEGTTNGAGRRIVVNRSEKQPYNAEMVKEYIENKGVSVAAVARAIGMEPTKFRNILRWDDRGFTEEDYNVIIKAVESVKQQENEEIF